MTVDCVFLHLRDILRACSSSERAIPGSRRQEAHKAGKTIQVPPGSSPLMPLVYPVRVDALTTPDQQPYGAIMPTDTGVDMIPRFDTPEAIAAHLAGTMIKQLERWTTRTEMAWHDARPLRDVLPLTQVQISYTPPYDRRLDAGQYYCIAPLSTDEIERFDTTLGNYATAILTSLATARDMERRRDEKTRPPRALRPLFTA